MHRKHKNARSSIVDVGIRIASCLFTRRSHTHKKHKKHKKRKKAQNAKQAAFFLLHVFYAHKKRKKAQKAQNANKRLSSS